MDKTKTTPTADPLEALRQGDNQTLQQIYQNHRNEFVAWACQHFRTDEDEAADVFQEAVITLYRNVVSNHLTQLTSSLKTYLFGIGRNKLLKRSARRSREDLLPDSKALLVGLHDVSFLEKEELNHRQQFLQAAIGRLSESCQRVLRLFYYRRFSMESIMHEMGYSSEEVARTTRLRCVRNLRKIVLAGGGDKDL